MIDQGFNWFREFLAGNDIASGGLMVIAAGWGLWLLRSVPGNIWFVTKRRFMLNIEVLDQDPVYQWLARWLAHHPYCRHGRRMTAISKFRPDVSRHGGPDMDGFMPSRSDQAGARRKRPVPDIHFIPAPGKHLIRYRGNWLLISREREKPSSGDGGGGGSGVRRESIHAHG